MDKYDSALLGILQNEGKVAPFLDAILGFLFRRTDFFRTMKTDHDKLGFPPGVAKKLLINIFSKYEMQASKDAEIMEEMKRTNAAANSVLEKEQDSKALKQNDSVNPSGTNQQEKCEESLPVAEQGSKAEPEDERGTEEVKKATDSKVNHSTADKSENGDGNNSVKDTGGNEDDKEDPEQALQRRLLQANPLTYNGADREHYFWSQTITETDLRVKIPAYIKKGKQVRAVISKKHIKVSHQTEDGGSWTTVMDDDMAWEVNTEESMWTLTPGEFVHINLEKREERWWECVFVDEPKINTRKIDCSRPMTDLDDEAQAKIEEMMYNQRQKQMGLPQSHEQKTHEMLRKAWDAEGSPFKGQPFDPSKFNVDPNGVMSMNQDHTNDDD